MTLTYKKLNEKQLKELYVGLRGYFDNTAKYRSVINLVTKYFSNQTPVSILVSVNSEYNDEGYDNSIQNITVYDETETELPLTRTERIKFQNEISGVDLPEFHGNDNYDGITQEPVEDVVIFLNTVLPDDLYRAIEGK